MNQEYSMVPLRMGSEDADSQYPSQSASASIQCESSTSYGITTVPFVTSVSIAANRSGNETPASTGTVMLAQSASSHTPPQNVAVQPSVAASPLPHVQVIQQPLQNQYLQHLYTPQQQHMFLPGNLTLQPTIQSIGGTPASISLQLQGKSMENKTGTPTILSAAPMQTVGSFGAQGLIPAGSQMATAKACMPGQMLATSSKSTVIQGQSGFIPATTSNQTVVIGQLGVLSGPQSVLPHQAKALADSQKGKSYLISQPATLHPKSPILPSPNVSCAGQMIATSQLKQLPSASHIITTQAPTMITNQAQLLGSLQALGVPPGIAWAAPGSLHSSALFGQNPIFIRSQQSDMFIQSPSPQATIHVAPQIQQQGQQQQQAQQQTQQMQQQIQPTQQQVQQTQQPIQPAQHQQQQQQLQQQQQQQLQQHQQQLQQQQQQQLQQQQQQPQPIQQQIHLIQPSPSITTHPPLSSTPAPQVLKPKPPSRPGSSVATQTNVSTSTASSSTSSKSQSKSKSRMAHSRGSSMRPLFSSHSSHSQTATTQTQTQPPQSQKADAANQTKPSSTEPKLASIYNKILEPFNKSAATETAFSPSPPEPVEIEESQAAQETPQPPLVAAVPDIGIVAPSPAVPLLDEGVQMEAIEPEDLEPAMAPSPELAVPPTPPIEVHHLPNRKDHETPDNVGIVMPMIDVVREKQPPQKAIVKPHVLTHVIEGFVIQEGSEPFPVSLPSYSIVNKDEAIEKPVEQYGNVQSSDLPVMKKKDKLPKIRSGPIELAKCEYCGKLGPKAKFKRSKRFCSTSCAKRFNSGSSKRLSIILPGADHKLGEEIRKHKKKGSKKGGKSKKKKLGLKSKKSWKKSERLYEDKEWNIRMVSEIQDESMDHKPSTPEDDVPEESPHMDIVEEEEEDNSTPVAEEEEESHSDTPRADCEMDAAGLRPTEFATKSPLKWTVTDVVDFVRSMPGCSDYADEFRSQEIDGQALLLLKEDHLMSLMSMKLGPALKVCARINSMRDQVAH